MATKKIAQTVITEDKFYTIAAANGKVVEVKDYNTGNGAQIQLWDNANAEWQQWSFVRAGDGVYRIKNRFTGKMLQIPMRRLMRIKSRSWVAIPKMHPKSTQKKPIALMATSFVKNGFGIRFLPLTCMKCDLFIQVQISNSLQHWILGMVNLDIIHKCLVSCLRFCV